MRIEFKRHPDGKLPTYAHDGDAGMDCYARTGIAFDVDVLRAKSVELGRVEVTRAEDWVSVSDGGIIARVPLGFSVAVPPGYYMELTCKSGLGFRGLQVIPGIIDSGYRGEVCAQVWAVEPVAIAAGDKICQALVKPMVRAEAVEVSELDATARDAGGFGSTGER